MSVVEVDGNSFRAEVLDRSASVPVVVDFWAPWCGPCRRLGPTLEALAAEAGGRWVLVKINTDESQALAQQYGIRSIPAVKAFVGGKVVDEFVGALPEPQIREFLARVVPDEGVVKAQAAEAALAAGDTAAADALYAEALAADPLNAGGLLHRARAALAAGSPDDAKAELAKLRPRDRTAYAGVIAGIELGLDAPPLAQARAAAEAAPEDSAATYGLACALVAAGEHAAGLERLLSLVKRDRKFGDDAARKAMLRVFDIVGVRSPLADEYRQKLSMELFK